MFNCKSTVLDKLKIFCLVIVIVNVIVIVVIIIIIIIGLASNIHYTWVRRFMVALLHLFYPGRLHLWVRKASCPHSQAETKFCEVCPSLHGYPFWDGWSSQFIQLVLCTIHALTILGLSTSDRAQSFNLHWRAVSLLKINWWYTVMLQCIQEFSSLDV